MVNTYGHPSSAWDEDRQQALDPPPFRRFRRLRRTETLRGLVRETTLDPGDFVYPLFVVHGRDAREPIASMPGQFRLSTDRLAAEARELSDLGVRAVLLFGLPASKDARGAEAYADDGIVQRAVSALKEADPELAVITDVCLCEYTDHGHCGVIRDGDVDNDASIQLLAEMAVSHARAGADIVAPSDMMDGRVAAIRAALDAEGSSDTPILSYAAKFASAYYGPFREAADSTPQFGDRRSYQMDPANGREALAELLADAAEGADMLMVKPALPYLDVLAQARELADRPLAAYHVSGEYAMLKAAALQGWLDEPRVAIETLTSIRRAGADLIITYYAKEAARWLAQARTPRPR